jgi:hypothetical protein
MKKMRQNCIEESQSHIEAYKQFNKVSKIHLFELKRTLITVLQGYHEGSTRQLEENKITRGMKHIKEAMNLHHHPHSPLLKNL